jgi:hypothetical protein
MTEDGSESLMARFERRIGVAVVWVSVDGSIGARNMAINMMPRFLNHCIEEVWSYAFIHEILTWPESGQMQ